LRRRRAAHRPPGGRACEGWVRGGGGGGALHPEAEEEAQADMADLVPRQDISGMVDDELCEKQKDKSWKVRKEGLDNLNDDSNCFHF
jgi:hypothetical protein